MSQYLKQDIQQRIEDAALQVFAGKGCAAATMAQIAQRAKISTGNIYRYFGSKEDLLLTVIPHSFVEELQRLLRAPFVSFHGIRDIQALAPHAPYRLVAKELLQFCVSNRLRVVVLLGTSDASVYAGFAASTVSLLQTQALEYVRTLDAGFAPSQELQQILLMVYRGFVQSLVKILAEHEAAEAITRQVQSYSRYHLAGLRDLFGFELEAKR
jgi:AcrR family transcriptional regulator